MGQRATVKNLCNRFLRKIYRSFKAKMLNSMLEVSDKNPSELWKIVNCFKDRSQDPSCNIAPQDRSQDPISQLRK
jgi:hypothetical protein